MFSSYSLQRLPPSFPPSCIRNVYFTARSIRVGSNWNAKLSLSRIYRSRMIARESRRANEERRRRVRSNGEQRVTNGRPSSSRGQERCGAEQTTTESSRVESSRRGWPRRQGARRPAQCTREPARFSSPLHLTRRDPGRNGGVVAGAHSP